MIGPRRRVTPGGDLDPSPVIVELHRCEYVSKCRTRDYLQRGTTTVRKLDWVEGCFICHVELCDRHAEVVAGRERERGLEVDDQRSGGL